MGGSTRREGVGLAWAKSIDHLRETCTYLAGLGDGGVRDAGLHVAQDDAEAVAAEAACDVVVIN